MGCVSPKKITHPEQLVVFPKGVLEVEIANAVLFRDTSIILKMDPYIVLKIGQQTLKSLIHKNEGTCPTFNQKFTFYINSDKIPYGRSIQISVWDHNVGIDRQIGYGIIDIDPILSNRMTNFQIKCHINHEMKSAGWVRTILSYRQDYKGKLLIKPKRAIFKRRIGLGVGQLNCAVKVVVGEDVSVSTISQDQKDSPPNWKQTLYLNLINSIDKGKLSIINVHSNSEEEVCYVDLNLNELSTEHEQEHELELKYKETHAGTIHITSQLLSLEQFQKHIESLIDDQKQGVDNNEAKTHKNSEFINKSVHQSVMIKSTVTQL